MRRMRVLAAFTFLEQDCVSACREDRRCDGYANRLFAMDKQSICEEKENEHMSSLTFCSFLFQAHPMSMRATDSRL